MAIDAEGYGYRAGEEGLERLLRDARVLSPAGIEGAAQAGRSAGAADPRQAEPRAICDARPANGGGPALAPGRGTSRAARLIGLRIDPAAAKARFDAGDAVPVDVTSSLVYPAVSHR